MLTHLKLNQVAYEYKATMMQRTEGKEVCGGIGINYYTHTNTPAGARSLCVQFLYPTARLLFVSSLTVYSLQFLLALATAVSRFLRLWCSTLNNLARWASQWRPRQVQRWSICHPTTHQIQQCFAFHFFVFCLGTDVVYLYIQYFVQPYISAVADTEGRKRDRQRLRMQWDSKQATLLKYSSQSFHRRPICFGHTSFSARSGSIATLNYIH